MWLGAIPNAKNNINTPHIEFEINTNASETEWGTTDSSNPSWGLWSENGKKYHINYLGLLAIKHAVMIFEDIWRGSKHVRTKSENTTAILYINNAGGTVSDSCNHLSKTMWYYCINARGWLSAVHIPGKGNETADYMSRLQNEDYHQLSFRGFLKFFTANLKLFSLHHA